MTPLACGLDSVIGATGQTDNRREQLRTRTATSAGPLPSQPELALPCVKPTKDCYGLHIIERALIRRSALTR